MWGGKIKKAAGCLVFKIQGGFIFIQHLISCLYVLRQVAHLAYL